MKKHTKRTKSAASKSKPLPPGDAGMAVQPDQASPGFRHSEEATLALVAQVAAAIHAQQWGRNPDALPSKSVIEALRLIEAVRGELLLASLRISLSPVNPVASSNPESRVRFEKGVKEITKHSKRDYATTRFQRFLRERFAVPFALSEREAAAWNRMLPGKAQLPRRAEARLTDWRDKGFTSQELQFLGTRFHAWAKQSKSRTNSKSGSVDAKQGKRRGRPRKKV